MQATEHLAVPEQNLAPSPGKDERTTMQKLGLPLALLALAVICLLPQPEGLPVAGQRMLGLLVFSVILWMTETVSYPVSAGVILAAMTLLLGFSPSIAKPEINFTMAQGLSMGLQGLANGAWAMVAAALFLASAMQITGFDRRLALKIMSLVGARSNRILLGVIGTGFVLSFFVPSTTARVACIVPIVMGIVSAFKLDRRGPLAGLLLIACAQVDSIWNVGIKTAAAQNMVAVGFIRGLLGRDISWMEWFIAAAPFAAIMSVALYFILLKMMPPEIDEIPGGTETIKKELAKLGPMSSGEKRLMFIAVCLLAFWVLEGKTWSMFGLDGGMAMKKIHPFDTSSITVIAVALLLLPGIGVMNWRQAQNKINWGTVFLFGVGISLGSAIMATKAGPWLAQNIVPAFGLTSSTPFMILVIMALFLIIIHMGFASATALASALIPIIISVLSEVAKVQDGLNVLGLTMILQYVVSFGMILPANAPQNMIAYGTDTFTAKQFIRTGIPLTIAAYGCILLLAATYWKWLGYV
jgi:anion transporter